MPRRDGKPSASISRRLNVRVAIYAPVDADDPNNLGDYGELDRVTRTFVGYDTVSISLSSANSSPVGKELASAGSYTVEMRRRNDIEFNHQLDVKTGSFAGLTLFVQAIVKDSADRAQTFTLLCK